MEKAAHLQNRRVLHSRSDDVVTSVCQRAYGASDRVIIRFRPATGENYLIWLTAKRSGNLASGVLYGRLGFYAKHMGARRVAKVFVDVRVHRFGYLRIYWSGTVVVKKYGLQTARF